MGRAKKMATVTSEGSRLERLENLALILAKQIDICAKDAADGPKTMPSVPLWHKKYAANNQRN